MANKHSSASKYMIQVKTESGNTESGNTESGTQTSYSNIKLMDAEESYFITADEIVRCLCETLFKESAPTSEENAETTMIATKEEVKNIATIEPTIEK